MLSHQRRAERRRRREARRQRRRHDGCDASAIGCDAGCCALDLFALPLLFGLVAGASPAHAAAVAGAAPVRAGRVTALLWRCIRFYQVAVSPRRPARCRMTPTCSTYGLVALERHGAARGVWLTVLRLRHCRPGGPTGLDPVPPAR